MDAMIEGHELDFASVEGLVYRFDRKETWFDIQGSIQANVDEDTFNTEFLSWIESKGWLFSGITKPQE
ncbi:hypothetical protein [Domibacillus aminovorans]|uniref:Uncharacterized protein n=1 Tax=Domibacillus aminovorans TaxID=29332 RepID=A0A177L5X0_9BACI|nr:hypothetical protein [Domibacillus aminovorans]OAH60737.1 hypothetical protein AWH49_15465 [Domibacillus aminovorans]